jgi:hypothetical protein
MAFNSIHLEISSLAASAMAKLSHNSNANEIEELLFRYDSEEQCTSNVFDGEHST